jgi:hypothetical protein
VTSEAHVRSLESLTSRPTRSHGGDLDGPLRPVVHAAAELLTAGPLERQGGAPWVPVAVPRREQEPEPVAGARWRIAEPWRRYAGMLPAEPRPGAKELSQLLFSGGGGVIPSMCPDVR